MRPRPTKYETPTVISWGFLLPASRATGPVWQGFTDFAPFLISDYSKRIFSELPNTLCASPRLE